MHHSLVKNDTQQGPYCSPAVPISFPAPEVLSVFTSSGSHYEIGLTIDNDDFVNIARSEYAYLYSSFSGRSFVLNNNLFSDQLFKNSSIGSNNQIVSLEFKEPMSLKKFSIPVRDSDETSFLLKTDGHVVITRQIKSPFVYQYLTYEFSSPVKKLELSFSSQVGTDEVRTRPMFLWINKSDM